MRLLASWTIVALAFGVSAVAADSSERCNFAKYRPLKIGTLIRGGHQDLAVKKVDPVYPESALRDVIGGSVTARVLVNRAGDVVKLCSTGTSVFVKV